LWRFLSTLYIIAEKRILEKRGIIDMNPVTGMFALIALAIVVFFGLPMAVSLALYRIFPPNFMKIGDDPLAIGQPMPLQADIPMPVSLKTQPVSFKMVDGSSMRGYKAFPRDST
jgi:hypothetical protein